MGYLCYMRMKGRSVLSMKRKLPRNYADRNAQSPEADPYTAFADSPERQARIREIEQRIQLRLKLKGYL